jgi:hypothetical protein
MESPMSLHRNEILGSWELLTFQARDTATGEIRHPLGAQPRGLILYTDDGFMSAQLAPSGEGAEIGDYIAYSGPFHVDEEASTVRHDVRMATMPDLLAQPQLRHVQLEPGRLTLSATMTDDAGATTHSILAWRRPASREE